LEFTSFAIVSAAATLGARRFSDNALRALIEALTIGYHLRIISHGGIKPGSRYRSLTFAGERRHSPLGQARRVED
jgi:hypothetical protein